MEGEKITAELYPNGLEKDTADIGRRLSEYLGETLLRFEEYDGMARYTFGRAPERFDGMEKMEEGISGRTDCHAPMRSYEPIPIYGEVTWDFTSEALHILLTAPSGAGKTCLLTYLGGMVLKRRHRLYVIDAKNSDFGRLFRQSGVPVATNIKEIIRMLTELVQEMEERYSAFSTDDSAGADFQEKGVKMDMYTEDLSADDYELYNRRTTDYGNGKIEIAAYHSPRLRHMGSGRNPNPSGREAETSDDAQEERTRQQIYAIRRRIKGYAFSNSFRWFVTLTFDPEKMDSSDYGTAKDMLLKWCRRMRDRHKQFDYLMIPELHKSGAVHFHGLFGGIPAGFVEAVNPKNGEPVIRHDRPIYNLTEWEYGFSDCEEIESPERAASYITKYVTAALLTDKKMYNKKRYFNSQGLARPAVSYGMNDNTELDGFRPNFGIIDTGNDGRNFIDIGIYNLLADPETGRLSQTDDDYLLIAKNKC